MFLGGLLVSSLTKLTVRALEAQGALSGAAKEMQVGRGVGLYIYVCVLCVCV